MKTDADLVIIGGGCAGLSLATRLLDYRTLNKKVIILDARESYENDRTWCFWSKPSHRFDSIITKSWQKMSISFDGSKTVADCGQSPYQMLEAAHFYAFALDAIQRSNDVKLRLGVNVSGKPLPRGSCWQIETDQGPLTANYVVDTRPDLLPSVEDSMLWQSFLGHEIECQSAVFDPDIVQLMDFCPNNNDNIQFAYILPISQTRALVETTIFGRSRLNAADLADLQSLNLARICGNAHYAIKRVEIGILPMRTTRPSAKSQPGYVQAGLFHGGARPSSGYAFQRIQRWADKCALAISQNQPPCGHAPDRLLTSAMDGLFLKVLRAYPEKGAEIFTRLFEKVDTARIIRFLSDTGNLTDNIAVASALPAALFFKQIISGISPKLVGGAAK